MQRRVDSLRCLRTESIPGGNDWLVGTGDYQSERHLRRTSTAITAGRADCISYISELDNWVPRFRYFSDFRDGKSLKTQKPVYSSW